jgi:YgiT-type zinc finger domain-containing protein
MKCVVCHSPDIERGTVDETFQVEGDIVLVPVELLVCNNCGERYYDRRTMRRLEEIEDQLRGKTLSLNPVGKVLRLVAESA